MGPRQVTAWVTPPGLNGSIEITRTPCPVGGMISPSTIVGFPVAPSIRGMLWPYTSASTTPTDRPRATIEAARFAVTDDLPTPPLPEAIR